jgi:hypothetical protein
VIHAVEVAEKAVINALRDEVDTLFNDKDHPHVQTASLSSPSVVKNSAGRRSKPHAAIATDDRNQFGWGLDQSIDF